MRASSVFPILSTILLLLGGLCIGAGRIYSRKNNIVLSAGILFVAAGKSGCPYGTRAAAVVMYLSVWSSLPGMCVLVGGQAEVRAWLTLRGQMCKTEARDGERLLNGVFFGGDDSLTNGGSPIVKGCTHCTYTKCPWIMSFRKVNWIVCEFHLISGRWVCKVQPRYWVWLLSKPVRGLGAG